MTANNQREEQRMDKEEKQEDKIIVSKGEFMGEGILCKYDRIGRMAGKKLCKVSTRAQSSSNAFANVACVACKIEATGLAAGGFHK